MVGLLSTLERNQTPDSEEEEEEEEMEKKPNSITFHKAVGFRFNPTDQELLIGYLKPYSEGEPLPKNLIHESNIYVYNPDQLSEEFEKANEKDFYFVTSRTGDERVSRSANGGFWHSTTGRRDVLLGNLIIGRKQHFTFFNGKLVNGKPPKDGKTNWLMVEYILLNAATDKKSTEFRLMGIDIRSSKTKKQKRNCVLSKIYRSVPVENQTEDYALIIKQRQEQAIQDEELWQTIRTEKDQ